MFASLEVELVMGRAMIFFMQQVSTSREEIFLLHALKLYILQLMVSLEQEPWQPFIMTMESASTYLGRHPACHRWA